MRNIGLIFRRDAQNLFRNAMSVIITIGLVLLPSLFAWYNILACWNVFDNTGNLSIAVANDDAGYTSDLVPLSVNIGEKVVSALRANKQINWVITNSDDAIEGTKSGKYYASLVIPENFSTQMLTFYENDAQSAPINYYVNEKKNAISPNITVTGAETVSYEINTTFAKTLSEVAVTLAKSLSQSAQDDNLDGKIALLTDRMRSISNRVDQTADVLGLYSNLANDSQGLLKSSSDLIEKMRAQADEGLANANESKQKLRELAEKLASSVDGLCLSLADNGTLLSDINSKLDALLADATDGTAAAAEKLREKATEVDGQVDDLNSRLAALEEFRDELHTGIGPEINAIIESGSTEIEIRKKIEVVVERTALLDAGIEKFKKVINALELVSDELNQAADDLETGNASIQERIQTLRQTLEQAIKDIADLKVNFDDNLKPNVDKLKTDIETLVTDLEAAGAKLAASGDDLPIVLSSAENALGEASGKVDDACEKLRNAAQNIQSLADAVDEALAKGDSETLRSLLSNNVEDIATAVSTPVQIQREALFPVKNFGSAMAPLYLTLALFIGSLLIMVAMKPEVSERGLEELSNPKPRELYFGRFGAVALVSLMQTTVLGLGSMFFLGVQVTEPPLFMLCFWITGLVFAFIVYTMVVAFGNLGKAIAVLMLIVQVTGCNGSYPLPLLPDFVQVISPFLPATHVVSALRAAMFGVYQNDFWISIGKLLIFVLPFLLLGLVLRKPLERFMRFYVSKVEESKIM